jgi:hypothetical protein
MDPVDNFRGTAQEVVSFAQQHGIDLEPLCSDGSFEKNKRSIFLWRKDELSYSGRPDEKERTLRYNMQGTISVVPSRLKQSASAFRGAWSEAGTLESLEQAYQLVKAWLLDGKEIDDLPPRQSRRYQI